MFVRGENQSQSVLEAEKEPTVNPDAIDLDSDDDSDEVRNKEFCRSDNRWRCSG